MSRILLVEDHEAIRVLTTEMLRRAGYEVVAVASAEEALARLDGSGDGDALITDMRLPGLSGADLVERVAGRHPPVLALGRTGGWTEPELDLGDELGAG